MERKRQIEFLRPTAMQFRIEHPDEPGEQF